ncbi:hypothetical protein B0H13DRAFT_1893058 [Mycena leptocephala]|nr:hypothetical protein B0H13DRAFT_1893058 [Mycena leptocephala]
MECFVLLGGGLWGPSSSSSEVDPGGASRFLGAGPPVEVLAVDFVRAIAVKRQEIHACVDRRNQSDAYIRAELFRIPDFSHNTIMHTKKRAYLIHFLLKYLDFNDGIPGTRPLSPQNSLEWPPRKEPFKTSLLSSGPRLVPVYRELAHCHRKIALIGTPAKEPLKIFPLSSGPRLGPVCRELAHCHRKIALIGPPAKEPFKTSLLSSGPRLVSRWARELGAPQDLPAVVGPASGPSMLGTRPLSPQNCPNWPPAKEPPKSSALSASLRWPPLCRQIDRKIALIGPPAKRWAGTLGTPRDLPAVVWPASGLRTLQDLPAVVWPTCGPSMPGIAHWHRKVALIGPPNKRTLQDLPAVVWPVSGPSIPGTRPLSPQNCLNWPPSKRTLQDLPAVVWPTSGPSMPGTRPLSPQNCPNWPPAKMRNSFISSSNLLVSTMGEGVRNSSRTPCCRLACAGSQYAGNSPTVTAKLPQVAECGTALQKYAKKRKWLDFG